MPLLPRGKPFTPPPGRYTLAMGTVSSADWIMLKVALKGPWLLSGTRVVASDCQKASIFVME